MLTGHPECLHQRRADRPASRKGTPHPLPRHPPMRSAKREAQMKRTKKPVPPPAAANSTGLTVTGGAHSNNWISASGETHGNGSSTSGGSLPRDPETARRDAKIVQEALDLRA